jgi:Family of unknown function (DUF6502)
MDTRTTGNPEVVLGATTRILHKLVRVLLRHGVSFQAFSDLAKRAYVEVAGGEFGIPGRKPSSSRIALLTGLSRKEVQRVVEKSVGGAPETQEHNRAARVVGGWIRDTEFHDGDGQPRALPFDGSNDGKPGFSELVRRYSGDVPPRAVLDELLRVGTASRDDAGTIRLLARLYLPLASDIRKLAILGRDVASLIATIDHNLLEPDAPLFHRHTASDNLPLEALADLKGVVAARGQALIEELDTALASHDRDVNPAVGGTGRARAGVVVFYFEQELEPADAEGKRNG